jgi:hypothetical protein
MKNKIVTLVMSNGAEIIGKFIADDFNSITIYKAKNGTGISTRGGAC